MKAISRRNILLVVGIFIIIIIGLVVLRSNVYSSIRAIGVHTPKQQIQFLLKRDTIPDVDTTSQRILLIGDSMAYSLMFRMWQYCKQNGHKLKVVSWVASSTVWYAKTDTLDYFIKEFKPTYIVFVIGSNELFIDRIKTARQWCMKKIMKKMEGIKTIWVGPPNWKNDTGINDLILSFVGYRRFFPSKKLTYERLPGDKAHPNRKSSAMWVDSLALWIKTSSLYPIRLDVPEGKDTTKPPCVVIKPLYTVEKDTIVTDSI